MKRGIVVAVLTAGIVASLPGTAPAQELDCGQFARTQTYAGWGPALHYGETVTIAFAAEECSGGLEDGAFAYSLSGSAAVYAGAAASGSPIDVQPFSSSGSFSGTGWPPAWWSCIAHADVAWEISGVYSFVARASDGHWTLDVAPDGVHWEHSAC